ncbi:Uncharacterised protein [Bordetella pertussis]|nr:Uncharacterised protein [Bordetella pertussis]
MTGAPARAAASIWRASGSMNSDTRMPASASLRRDRALEVHAGAQQGADGVDVGVLDVAAVFAQMQRDQVGAGVLGAQRRLHRVGISRVALLPQRGHMVDVDT